MHGQNNIKSFINLDILVLFLFYKAFKSAESQLVILSHTHSTNLITLHEAINMQSVNTQLFIKIIINNYMFRLFKAAIIRPYVSEM